MSITSQRSTTDQSNIQEVLDSDHSAGMFGSNQAQYETPKWLADECASHLPSRSPATIYDPQAFKGALLMLDGHSYGTLRFSSDIDNRIESIPGSNHIVSSCTKVWEIVDDLFPNLRFICAVANIPFGRKWKIDGEMVDSTKATWDWLTAHAHYGYLISSRTTIEKLGLHQHQLVYKYETRKLSEVWSGMRADAECGIVWWQHKERGQFTQSWELASAWEKIREAVNQEKVNRPDFNIYLNPAGLLRTYLSVRSEVKLKLTQKDIQSLSKINDCHPLTLTTEKETRLLLHQFVTQGVYRIQPEAKAAIERALEEVKAMACPIMPVTEFERVAYCDEEETLLCIKSFTEIGAQNLELTRGVSYPLSTGSYKFTEGLKRNKVHFNESAMETYVKEHDCVLSGSDRYIQITDDNGREIRFMDRPRKNQTNEFDERLLWDLFQQPVVNTVAETCAAKVEQNLAVLRALEMTAGYEYFKTANGGGQMGYLARVAVKDAALIAAETGAGKSLMAISLLAMKSPRRALIVAPQGAIRSTESEDDDEEGSSPNAMDASQWVKELTRFAPYLQVFEIFSHADYERICSMNGGSLPEGAVYVTYYEAMFSNGAREKVPDTWDDIKLNKWAKSVGLSELALKGKFNEETGNFVVSEKRFNCDTVGKEVNGIRCIIAPCLSTLIGHEFDCVLLDEAHKAANLDALVSQMIVRLQPKHRYALTATPIPNIISNLFSLMGWLAVPEWHKGKRLNASFPYARGDIGKFNSTFLSMERDLTQEDDNRRIAEAKGEKWSGSCTKESPIISSPARLLKILKPTIAFISKADCSDTYIPPKVTEVRVPMGKEQTRLYGHFLDRANIPASNPLVRARKQTAWLRNICTDPAGFRHGGPKVFSNLNPKVITILELTRDCLARGEQVVIINSRLGITSTIHEKLCEAGVSIARIDSTLDADQHSGQANLFKEGKARILLMGIKCAAAYSFDDCDNLIIGSLEFSPGPLNQAKGRIDRLVNKKIKNIYVILHKNSLEEMQHDTVGVKDDAATICLRGKRVPRDFVPMGASDVLAKAVQRFDLSAGTPETECEKGWPELRKRITAALQTK